MARVDGSRWSRVEFCRVKIEGNKEKIETEEADLGFLVHKRKSLEGQYEDWLRRMQVADRRLALRTRWINFWGDRRERLEAQEQTSGGWEVRMAQARRMLARAREKVPKWRAEHEAVEVIIENWLEI